MTGAALRTLEGHSGPVNSVAFSPNAKREDTLFILNGWVVEENRKLLWLPHEYRGISRSIWKRIIVLGHSSGRISILEFKEGLRYI
jgi:WD40 repeat protein